MMMRFWPMMVLLVLLGCSSSEPPVKPTNVGDESQAEDSQGSAEEKSPAKVAEQDHVPTFTPTKTTPITTGPDQPDSAEPATPDAAVKLTEKMKSVVADLINPNPMVKDQAQIDLESSEFKPVDILLAAAKDENATVRAGAVYGLSGRFNQFNAPMMKVLQDSLGDTDPKVRSLALSAVSEMPPQLLATALGHLANILSDPSEPSHVRAAAARLIGKVSSADLDNAAGMEQSALAFKALQKALLTDTDRSIQLASLSAVVGLAPSSADAVLVLSKVIVDSKDEVLRRRAAEQLGDLGDEAASAVPALISTLDSSDARLAGTAADALVRIGSSAVPLLGEKAAQGEKPARLLAIGALAQLGPTANASKVFLQQAAQDSDKEIQAAAQAALQKIDQ